MTTPEPTPEHKAACACHRCLDTLAYRRYTAAAAAEKREAMSHRAVIEPKLRPLVSQCQLCHLPRNGHACHISIGDENSDPQRLIGLMICRRCAEELAALVEERRLGV